MAVASLPMYDLPELREATDAWWRGLARAFAAEGLEDAMLTRLPRVLGVRRCRRLVAPLT